MEFITTNGKKKVTIKVATFKEMCELKTEAMKCLLVAGRNDLINLQGIDKSKALESILEVLIAADSSEDFNKAVFKCLGRCTYDEFYTITPQFFEDKPEAIEDYYEIVAKCVEVNLRPFFKSLVTAFKANMDKMTSNTQQSK